MADYTSVIDTYNDLKKQWKAASDEDKKSLKSGMINTAIGGGLSAIQGMSGILDTSLQLAQGLDDSAYRNQLSDMSLNRDKQYFDYNSLADDMTSRNYGFTVEKNSLGPSGGEIAKGSGQAALTGAQAGLQIGGPWGALVGGVIGAGSGLVGGLVGRNQGRMRENILNKESSTQNRLNSLSFGSKTDNVRKYQYGQLYGNRAAEGGLLQTRKSFSDQAKSKHMTIMEFVNKVKARQNAARLRYAKSGGIDREKRNLFERIDDI